MLCWRWDSSTATWLYGEYQAGIGVFGGPKGWHGNICVGRDIVGYGPVDNRDDAFAEGESELRRLCELKEIPFPNKTVV